MKKLILSFSLILFVLFCKSCELTREPITKNELTCKATYLNASVAIDSLFFTENDIEYFNPSTKELKFKTSFKLAEIKNFDNFRFYLGKDSLFSARLAVDEMSFMINNLVFYYNYDKGKIYLEDGYPIWIDSSELATLRAQNKAKRNTNWQNFMDRLDYINKLKN